MKKKRYRSFGTILFLLITIFTMGSFLLRRIRYKRVVPSGKRSFSPSPSTTIIQQKDGPTAIFIAERTPNHYKHFLPFLIGLLLTVRSQYFS